MNRVQTSKKELSLSIPYIGEILSRFMGCQLGLGILKFKINPGQVNFSIEEGSLLLECLVKYDLRIL